MDLHGAATRMLEAWRDPARLLSPLPEAMRPAHDVGAYAIQAAVMAELGPIGGWKVGAPGPEAEPNCAPMPLSGIQDSPASLPARLTLRGIESEICFRMARDLPSRLYTREEVADAVASCHPALELLQSRFADDAALDAHTRLADFLSHGAFVPGPAIEGWRDLDFARLTVIQTVDGAEQRRGTGNPAGDMLRLLAWLAGEGARWAGGLRAGQYVTCGSWTGKSFVHAGARVAARFGDLAPAEATFPR